MSHEIIFFSHYGLVDGGIGSVLGVLYDRVILPLADFAASESPVATQLLAACPEITRIRNSSRYLREGEFPVCRALTTEDTTISDKSFDNFPKRFMPFLVRHGISNWQELCEKNLSEAIGTLHAFLTAALLEDSQGRERQVVYFCGHGTGPSAPLYQKIAAVLEIELD